DEPEPAGPVRVTLCVVDDGAGIDLAAARESGGMGLPAMEERARELGGQLTVDGAPGSGTRIVLIWTAGEGGDSDE
ncbi:MAG: hypothetical protein GWN58_55315, partial [Anaerolineae bacterium]|nr:hypothetical protein [Anaerolineae bacterium]